jgi:hypothetical protein
VSVPIVNLALLEKQAEYVSLVTLKETDQDIKDALYDLMELLEAIIDGRVEVVWSGVSLNGPYKITSTYHKDINK